MSAKRHKLAAVLAQIVNHEHAFSTQRARVFS